MSRKGKRKRGNSPEVIRAALILKDMKYRVCERCGSSHNVHLHHVDGNWKNNDITNFQFLCREHHLQAHGGNFKNSPNYILNTNILNMNNITFDYDFKDWDNLPTNVSPTDGTSVSQKVHQDYRESNFYPNRSEEYTNRNTFFEKYIISLAKEALLECKETLDDEVPMSPMAYLPTRSGKGVLIGTRLLNMVEEIFGPREWLSVAAPEKTPLWSIKDMYDKQDDYVVFDQLQDAYAYMDDQEHLFINNGIKNSKKVIMAIPHAGISQDRRRPVPYLQKIVRRWPAGFLALDEASFGIRDSGEGSSVKNRKHTRMRDTGNPSGPDSVEVIPKFIRSLTAQRVPTLLFTATPRRSGWDVIDKIGEARVRYKVFSSEISDSPIRMISFCSSLLGANVISFDDAIACGCGQMNCNLYGYGHKRGTCQDKAREILIRELKRNNNILTILNNFLEDKGVAVINSRMPGRSVTRPTEFTELVPILMHHVIEGNPAKRIATSTSKFIGYYDPTHPNARTHPELKTGGWVELETDRELFRMADDPNNPLQYIVFKNKGTTGTICSRIRWICDLRPFAKQGGRSDIAHPTVASQLYALGKGGLNSLWRRIHRCPENKLQLLMRGKDLIEIESLLETVDTMINDGSSYEEILKVLYKNSYFITVSENEDEIGKEIHSLVELLPKYWVNPFASTKKLVESMCGLKGI